MPFLPPPDCYDSQDIFETLSDDIQMKNWWYFYDIFKMKIEKWRLSFLQNFSSFD